MLLPHPRVASSELIDLAREFNLEEMKPAFRESLKYRPTVTKFDAAVNLAIGPKTIEAEEPPVETIILWNFHQRAASYHSKFGGYPYLTDAENWPMDTDGKPLLFVCQMMIEESFVDGFSSLPGNLVRIFASQACISRSAVGAYVVRVNSQLLKLLWTTIGHGSNCSPGPVDVEIEKYSLPFECFGEVLTIDSEPKFSTRAWKCTRFRRGRHIQTHGSRATSATKQENKFGRFLQLSSLDIGFERSSFFKSRVSSAKDSRKWPSLETGPVLFGDLESVEFTLTKGKVHVDDFEGSNSLVQYKRRDSNP